LIFNDFHNTGWLIESSTLALGYALKGGITFNSQQNSAWEIISSFITSNLAHNFGGVFYNDRLNSAWTILSTVFLSNTVRVGDGGVIYNSQGNSD